MRKLLLVIPLGLLLLGLGAISLGTERELSLTIYSHDLALVSETRTIGLDSPMGRLALGELPSQLIPSSVHLEGLEGELEILEQEFSYEPLSKSALLERFIGKEIEVRDGGSLYRGTLLGLDGGAILEDRAGYVQIIKDPDGYTLPALPEFATEPTLLWLISGEFPGEQRVSLSYLTHGLSWETSYTAVLDEEEMALRSWVTIANSSGLSYEDAALRLVAGEPHRVATREAGYAKAMMAEAAPPGFVEEAAFEYHLYTLPRPATIADGQSKQLSFISASGVQVERNYIYEGQVRDGVLIEVEFLNATSNGLGQPLPAGTVRFYQNDLFVGEDRISHTPVDERVSLTVGKAFDLVGERTEVEHRKLAERRYRDSIRITLGNHKEEPVTIKVVEHLRGDWTILQSSPSYRKVEASTVEFEAPVPAGGQAQVTYTVEYQL